MPVFKPFLHLNTEFFFGGVVITSDFMLYTVQEKWLVLEKIKNRREPPIFEGKNSVV